jgi:hypothetical protein
VACDVNIGMCANGSKARNEIKRTQKTTKGFSKGVSKSFGNIAKAAGLAGGAMLALTKTIQFVKGSIKSVSDFEMAVAKLDNVIRATGGAAGLTIQEMMKMADELQTLTIHSNTAALEAQGILATFKGIGETVFPDALEAAGDMSIMFGNDLRQASIQLGIALNDPITGMSRLRRIGIVFTEEQQNMIRTLQESGDIIGAQAVVLKELQTEFGGAARALRDTFGGSVKALSNNFSDLQRNVGILLTQEGGLRDLIDTLNEFLEVPENMRNIIRGFQSFGLIIVTSFRLLAFGIRTSNKGFELLFNSVQDVGSLIKVVLDPRNLRPKKMKEALAGISFTIVDSLRGIKDDALKIVNDTRDSFLKILDPSLPELIIKPTKDAIDDLSGSLNDNEDNIDDLTEAYVAGYFPALQSMSDMTMLFTDSVRQSSQALINNQIETAKAQTIMEELAFTAEFASTTFSDSWTASLESAFATTDDLGTKMKNLMKELFASLLTAIGKQMAIASAAYFLSLQFGKGAAAAGLAALAFTGAAAIRSLQQGGVVPGRGGGDVVPILAEPGEVVLSKETVRRNQAQITSMNGGMGEMPMFQIFLGNELIFDSVEGGIQNRNIKIRQEDISQ